MYKERTFIPNQHSRSWYPQENHHHPPCFASGLRHTGWSLEIIQKKIRKVKQENKVTMMRIYSRLQKEENMKNGQREIELKRTRFFLEESKWRWTTLAIWLLYLYLLAPLTMPFLVSRLLFNILSPTSRKRLLFWKFYYLSFYFIFVNLVIIALSMRYI